MRRKEFQVEEEEVRAFMRASNYGILGTVGKDGMPHMKPLNFVYEGDHIYFHGSLKGEKVDDLGTGKATFLVAKEYSLIPSTFMEEEIACPATAFFKSVYMWGDCGLVTDIAAKMKTLAALMEKLQPEGGYRPFDVDDPEYLKNVKGTAVFALKVKGWTTKFKFGQNMSLTKKSTLTGHLEDRGRELDLETVAMMRRFCPHAKP